MDNGQFRPQRVPAGESRMKKQIAFIGAAAAALMMAGTAHADGGYVGLSYNNNSDSDVNSWTVDGAFASSNFQVDGGYTHFSDFDANQWDIGGHLFSRSDTWLWGAYAGYNNISQDGLDDLSEWTVALQTQFYMPRTTISGDLSYSQVSDFPFLGDITTTQLSGEARFFATDNFSFQGNLGWGNLDADGVGSDDFWSYGVGAEWQADSFPVSIFANWEGFNSDDVSSDGSWRIGVRYNWGGTLLQRNRSGAGLNRPGGILDAIF
jgi:hypothetical protein